MGGCIDTAPTAEQEWTVNDMPMYKATACRYETAYIEADNEDEALDAVMGELDADINRPGYVDDYEIVEMDGE